MSFFTEKDVQPGGVPDGDDIDEINVRLIVSFILENLLSNELIRLKRLRS